jgi:hypothetical protein
LKTISGTVNENENPDHTGSGRYNTPAITNYSGK